MAPVHTHTHGGVNLIGGHTDYNGGFVLAASIPQSTQVELTLRSDKAVFAASSEFTESVTYQIGEERPCGKWADFIQGATYILAREGLYVRGFEALIVSNIPVGRGLASSTALTVALLKGLDELFHLGLDGTEIARFARMVENDFVGKAVGTVDSLVCMLGQPGQALFVDTRDLTVLRMPLPADETELLVVDVAHGLSQGTYLHRQNECEEAALLLGVRQLRDLGIHDLPRLNSLPEILHRRARHVITENARVLDAVSALQAHDFIKLGRLLLESQTSLRQDFEVSPPEIDSLLSSSLGHPDIFGARQVGDGRQGLAVILVRSGRAVEVAQKVCGDYQVLVPERWTGVSHSPTFHTLG